MKNIYDKILIFLKGLLMWMCDVVPGVSGWTIAVITWIYERLINAIKNVLPSLKLFFNWSFKKFWKSIDGNFLCCLICGIGVWILWLAHAITTAMENYPILIWSFFVGLILVSSIFLWKQVKWNWKTGLFFVFFAVLAYFITSPENAPIKAIWAEWYTFVCGMIAICAMILPWISGSFMLVLLWKYEDIMLAVKNFDIMTICLFIAWAVIWIVLFSNILSWLFKNFKMITLASLTWFMLWSLNKIWPWKSPLESIEWWEMNVLPRNFWWEDNHLVWAIICMILWITCVLLIEYLWSKVWKNEKELKK